MINSLLIRHQAAAFLSGSWLLLTFTVVAMLSGCDTDPPEEAPISKWAGADRSQFPDDARTPPVKALTGPGGIRWLTLASGSESRPDDNSSVSAKVSIWTMEGKLVASTRDKGGSSAFSMNAVQPFIGKQLQTLGVGGRARVWFPPGTAGRWINVAWRRSALLVEIKILSFRPTDTHTVVYTTGAKPYRFVLPDAGGAPAEALATPEGIRYVYMAHSRGELAKKNGSIKFEITAWQPAGIMLGKPLFRERKTRTSLSRVPESLAGVLGKMRVDETIRLWLSPDVATALLSVPEKPETIVDITLLAIE